MSRVNSSDELNFLSQKCKDKLNEITSSMSNFILLSTFREAEKELFKTDTAAHYSIESLCELKQIQITKLVQDVVDECNWLTLPAHRKRTVLEHLFVQTEKNRVACRLDRCSHTFFKKIFEKCELSAKPQVNINRPPYYATNPKMPKHKHKQFPSTKPYTTMAPPSFVQFQPPQVHPASHVFFHHPPPGVFVPAQRYVPQFTGATNETRYEYSNKTCSEYFVNNSSINPTTTPNVPSATTLNTNATYRSCSSNIDVLQYHSSPGYNASKSNHLPPDLKSDLKQERSDHVTDWEL